MSESQCKCSSAPTVAVLGATGFVGRHLVRELVSRGWHVRAMVRDRIKAARSLPDQNVSYIMGDVFDQTAMDSLLAGANAVVNLIGIRRELSGGVTFEKLHVRATNSAVAAAQRAGVTRFLQMSALGTRPGAASLYHRTKWTAEMLVRDSGLNWTIIRPSLILGPEGEFMEMAKGWSRGTEQPKHFLPYFSRPDAGVGASAMIRPVSVHDVAFAMSQAICCEDSIGEIVPMVGPEELTWPDLLIRIRDVTPGTKMKLQPIGVPALVASNAALVMEKIGLGSLLPFGPSEPIMAAEDNTGSPVKERELLGVMSEPLEQTLRWSAAG
jgi:uncharacterized protein YbjT (DUF2867 family)